MTSPLASPPAHPTVFFDGVCGLCNRFVDRLLRADKRRVLRFAPLQGETARALLPPLPDDAADWTVIYLDERGMHVRSDAALEIWRRLGGVRGLLALARFVPRFVRDPIYRWIARHRYRWFGRRDTCRVPSPAERPWFLP
jgi:predicted DCC family thiol-disulfide oxidoreductase YuxK